MDKLIVQVRSVRFKKETTGGGWWMVLDTDRGKCSGCLSYEPIPNERMELTGEFTTWSGQSEFKFKLARPDVPDDWRTLLHYVCERVRGIGDKKEEAIWQALGKGWPQIKPGDVAGLKDDVINDLLKQYRDIQLHDEQYKTIAWLRGLGAGPVMAAAAWEKWKDETVGVVKENCFALTQLAGIGFKSVDASIRRGLHIADHDPRRIAAGIIYAIDEAADGGTAVPFVQVQRVARELLECSRELIANVAASLICSGDIIVFDNEYIATKKQFEHEKMIWEFGKNGKTE